MKRVLLALAAALVCAAVALADDVLSDYAKRYTKTAYQRDKELVLEELAASTKPEALKALDHCVGVSRALVEERRKEAEKLRPKYEAARDAYDERFRAYAEAEMKKGNPSPTQHPPWPEYDDLNRAQANLNRAQDALLEEQRLVALALDARGNVLSALPEAVVKPIREAWAKSLASKDWGVRADVYEIVGHTRADWATEMLLAGAAQESDPRVIVVVVDGLAGRDPAKVGKALAEKMDDARWLVRVAAVAALENTPSKEGIDAIVKRLARESGRLKEDCARALRALTGEDLPANPEMWRVWWESNREQWKGKPPKKPDGPDPLAGVGEKKSEERKTGFFGLTIESRRVVFVIDVSGSMNEAIGGGGPDAKTSRAEFAKRELKQAVTALEDGAIFNLVLYSGGVHVWKPEMQTADDAARKAARDFVDEAKVVGGTNTFDALEAAFGLGDIGKGKKKESDPTGDARVDTIVFLSDGKPTVGRVTDPDAIRAAVREWNKARRVAVHAIAFGGDADAKFMKGLADDTGGNFLTR